MGKRSKAEARQAEHRQRAERLRAKIRERSAGFGAIGLGLVSLMRISEDASFRIAVGLAALGAVVYFYTLRKGWMREYRDALSAAGIDPERDELVESGEGAGKAFLILFGVFGGMGLFLAVFIWLARR